MKCSTDAGFDGKKISEFLLNYPISALPRPQKELENHKIGLMHSTVKVLNADGIHEKNQYKLLQVNILTPFQPEIPGRNHRHTTLKPIKIENTRPDNGR